MRFVQTKACAVVLVVFGVACGGAPAAPANSPDPSAPGASTAQSGVAHETPDFALEQVPGPGKVTLRGLKGKVVILDFWATWCEPCRASFPKLQELHERYKQSGLQIVGISLDDDPKEIPSFVKTYGAKFAIASDPSKDLAKKFNVKTMPSSFVLDRKGVVRFTHEGYHNGDEVELERQIRSLL